MKPLTLRMIIATAPHEAQLNSSRPGSMMLDVWAPQFGQAARTSNWGKSTPAAGSAVVDALFTGISSSLMSSLVMQ